MFERLEVEFQPLAREKGLELRIVPTRAWVSSDRRLLRRMLQNLVSNAIKYTATGRVLLGVRRDGARLSIQVHDTGPGIPITKRSLIFKEFQRLEETAQSVRGLGLGLAIVERIGKVLDHAIELHSVPGQGSMFAVVLPRAAAPADRALQRRRGAGRGADLAGLNVLCIDNEPDVLNALCVLLEGWGCTAIAAVNRAEAIARLRAAGAEPGRGPGRLSSRRHHGPRRRARPARRAQDASRPSSSSPPIIPPRCSAPCAPQAMPCCASR